MVSKLATFQAHVMLDSTYRPTGCWLLWLRSDLSRDVARGYWRGPHAERVGAIPHLLEYRQHHLALEDHGFWRSPSMVGAEVPEDWRVDGMPEVTFDSVLGSVIGLGPAARSVFPDEANAFDRVLCHLTGPRGGRWRLGASGAPVGTRAVVLIRRRPRVHGWTFRRFVHEVLANALASSPGTVELRTHVFLPYSRLAWPTPAVAHDNPPHRRYHAAIVLGAPDRESLEEVLDSPTVTATREVQREHCVALHAYAVDETVAVVEPVGRTAR
jgi:hypothetical protein